MTSSTLTQPPLSDADLWEKLRGQGLDPATATLHVERRRFGIQPPAEPRPLPTKAEAVLRSAAQAGLSGFGDELVGTMLALDDPSRPYSAANRNQNIDMMRGQISEARVAHPLASLAGTIGGTAVNPLNKLLGPLTAGLSPAASGAVTGGALFGAQGFGEGSGTPKQRLPMAGVGAATGAIVGGVTGKFTAKLLPIARTIWRNIRGSGLPPAQAQAVTEAAIRKVLHGQPPEVVENVVQSWKATAGPRGGPLPGPPPEPVALRPGETITPIAPQGFAVTGTRATPPVPTTPTILEMQQGYRIPPPTGPMNPQNPDAAARAAYNLTEAAGAGDPRAAAARVAGFARQEWDPRQALLLALLAGGVRQR